MWGCLECACFVGGTVRKPLEGSLEACLSPAAVMVTAVRGMAERGLGTRFSKMKELPLLSVSHLSLQSGPHSLLTSRQLLALAKASSVFHGARSSDRTPSTNLDAVITLCSLIAGLSQLQDTALAGFLLLLHPCSSAPWPRARVVLGLIFGPLAFLFILPPSVVSSCVPEFQTPSICYWSKVMSQAPDLFIWLLFRVSIGMSKTCLKHTWPK